MTINRRALILMSGAAALVAPKVLARQSGTLLYENPLASASDVKDFRLEGEAHVSFPDGRMVMENGRPPEDGQAANFVYWCPETFPRDIEISWKFRPLREPGLCILFFAAQGLLNGEKVSLFDPRLAPRQGLYDQYNNSDIEYLSLSYFRRRWAEERNLHLINLRSAPGFEMLAQGADPIPSAGEDAIVYNIRVQRKGCRVTFAVQDLVVLDWTAPADKYLASTGHIGFRQMAPLKAEYANLRVKAI